MTDAPPFETVYLSGLIRDPYGAKMSKTKGNTVDPLATIDELGRRRAPVRARPRDDPGPGPAVRHGEGRERPELRQQAVERHALRHRRTAGVDRRGRRAAAARRRAPRPRRSLAAVACRGDDRRRGPGDGRVQLRRGHPRSSTTRSGTSTATGASSSPRCASPTSLPRRRPRGDLVGARRGARHVPPPAPPGDAVHHRDAVGRACRTARPIRGCSIVARWPGVGERDLEAEAQVEALIELVRAVRNARADAKLEPGGVAAARRVRGAGAGARARGAPARAGAARARASAAAPPHPRGPPRDGRGGGRRARRHRRDRPRRSWAPGRPTRRPRTPTGRGSRRSSRTRSGCSRRPAPAWPTSAFTAKAPAAIVEGARRPRGGARRPGRPAARPPRPLARGAGRRRRTYRSRAPPPLLRCDGSSSGRRPEDVVPLFKRAIRPEQPAQARPSRRRAGLPEEVVAQEYQLKLYYAGKSSEGVRLKAGPAGARGAARHAHRARRRATSRSSTRSSSSTPRRCRRSPARPRRCSGSTPTTTSARSPATRSSSSSRSTRSTSPSTRSPARCSTARPTRPATRSTTR